MEISWLGHSCFRIKGNRTTVITDPYAPDLGYSLGKQAARIITVSHQHAGHAYAAGVEGEPRVIGGPGEYEISGVLIIGMPSFHDAEGGKSRGKNTIYLIEIDEISVCHLGDLGHVLTAGQTEEIEDVDVLLVPVGGVTTIDAAQAAQIVRQLEPKLVVPMHYKTDALERELEPVDRFLKEMGAQGVSPQPKLTVTRANLPPGTRVVLLNY